MKRFLFLTATLLMLAACGSKGNKPGPEENDTTHTTASITEGDLFSFDKVADYLEANNDDKLKNSAKQKFHTAIDTYRNKKNPQESLAMFRESLTLYPTPNTYYEYGNALLDSKKYEDAVNAYHMAEKLNYSPLSKVLYNLACAYSLLEDEDAGLKYMQLSIENGYDNREHMLKDSDLDFIRKSERFREVYETSYGGATSPEAALFDLFESNFEKVSLPYSISLEKSQKLNTDNSIVYDFERFIPQMVNSEFSRDVGDDFFYIANLHQTEKYVALIYAGSMVYTDYPPQYYYLTTYDPQKGKVIDQIDFAGLHYYGEEILEGSIGSDLTVEVKSYDPEWENDPEEYGYKNNKIINKNLTATVNYRIDEKGKIVASKKVLGQR